MKGLKIRLFNIGFIAASVGALVSILTQPIFKTTLSMNLTPEVLSSTISDSMTSEGEGGSEAENQFAEALSPEKLEQSLGKKGIELSFTIDLPARYAFSSDAKELNDYVFSKENGLIYQQIYNVSYEVAPKLAKLVKNTAKDFAKEEIINQVKNQIQEQIKDSIQGEASEKAKQIYDEHPELENTISNITENVFDLLDNAGEEGVTTGQLIDTIMGTKDPETGEYSDGVIAVLETLQDAGVEGFGDFDPDSFGDAEKEQIQEAMVEALESVPGLTETDPETGETVIKNLDEAILALLDMLGGEENPDINGEGNNGPTPIIMKRGETPSSDEKYAEKLIEKLEQLIPEDLWKTDISLGGNIQYILLGVIGLFAFPWVLFLLVTIIRTLRKGKCWTKPWIVFVFAFFQLILGLGLTVGLKVALPTVKPLITDTIGGGESEGATALLPKLLETINLEIQTSALIPSIIYLVFIPATIVYMIVCHKYKKEYKEEKKAKKASKKAA